MTEPLRIDGVDISHYQNGDLDLGAAKRAGVKFIYHKATESTGYEDPNYAKRRAEVAKAGIPFGGYHFARPVKGGAKAEAEHFIEFAQPKPGDLRPALDLETNDRELSRAELTAWVKDFVAVVKAKTGVVPVIYTPFALDDNFGALLWQPRYNNTNTPPKVPAPWKQWDVWQFSNGEYGVPNAVAGLGHVDINHMRDDLTVGDLCIPMTPVKEVVPVANTVDKILAIAKGEVGTQEGGKPGAYNNDQKYSDELPGFKWSDGQPWCATFVNWVFWKAGMWDLIPKAGRSASCDVLGKGFKDAKQWGKTPKVGAVVLYGTPSDLSHTGIVIEVGKDYIIAVEGNTNDEGSREGHEVAVRKRALNSYIVGYGYPKYDEAPAAPAPAPAEAPVRIEGPKAVTKKAKTHVVRKGETLTSIGRLYGVSWRHIAKWSHISNPNVIKVGQKVIVSRPVRSN